MKIDPYGPESPDFVVGDDFAHMWCSALAFCQKRFEGKLPQYKKEPSGGIGSFTADSFPVFDRFCDNVYVIADSNHGYKMIGVGHLVADDICGDDERPAGAVPLLALRRGQTASRRPTARSRGAERERGAETERTALKQAAWQHQRTGETPMTDLEVHVNAKGRKELVKQVREKIKELGIQYIYYQFVSVTGRIVGKGVPADHWESVPSAASSWSTARPPTSSSIATRTTSATGPRPPSWSAFPIPRPSCSCPGTSASPASSAPASATARRRINPGGHLTSDCRGNLRIIHEEFKKTHKGLHLRHGCEPEMMWLKKGADGLPDGGFSKPNCYHIDQFESLRPVFMRVIEYSRAMGLDMIQGDHEDAPGQLELNLMFDDCLRTADRLTTYRQICAQVAREFNIIACFMAKPFMGVSASGCHHNLSLWRGGEEKLNKLGPGQAAGHGGQLHLPQGRREHLHAA